MGKYDDIINLPHYVSDVRPRMSRMARAAQFAPFAALTGYDDELKETARLTDSRAELDEYVIAELNEKLLMLRERIGEQNEAEITYFVADLKKSGGKYVTEKIRVKKIDEISHFIVTCDNKKIPVDDIYEINLDFESDVRYY